MKDPYFSIIIPTFNRENVIIDTLHSIQCQTFQSWECIIIDDGSTDNSLKKISEFIKDDQRFSLKKRDSLPKGPTKCRNIGLKFAKANKIIFFDSDDLFLPWALQNRYSVTVQKNEIDLCLFQSANFYQNKKIQLRADPTSKNQLDSILSFEPVFGTPDPVWDKDFINKIGGWNEKIEVWDDPEIHARAMVNKARIEWGDTIPDCLIRCDNVDEFKLTNFKRSLQRYETILDSYLELYKSLNTAQKDLFKKNIISQIYRYAPSLERRQILSITEWLRKNNFIEHKEYFAFKKLTLNYFKFCKIPIIRRYFYKKLLSNVIPVSVEKYNDDEIIQTFSDKFHIELSKKKYPFLEKINLNLKKKK